MSATQERHIASFIIYVQPEHMQSLIALLVQWPDTDISHRDASGKFVLVNECDSYDSLNRLMAHLHEQTGVLNVALVSHFVEDDASLSKPMIVRTDLAMPAAHTTTPNC